MQDGPEQSPQPRKEPGVWTGVKIFFGGCIVLPILLVLGVVACTVLVGSLNGGGSP